MAGWGLTFLAQQPWSGIFGAIVVALFFLLAGLVFHLFATWGEFNRKILARTSILQYLTFQFFAITVLAALPVKLILRLLFRIKYVWVTPWFNV